MDFVCGCQYAISDPAMNQTMSVSTVRIRILRGVAFMKQMAGRG